MPSVFVAYPYAISKEDYRGAYAAVAEEFGVEFTYADEEITNKHILEKIEKMMQDADFSLFDITNWNANVALELGLAIGRGYDYYILWNPTGDHEHPPADIGGIDRIQYEDFAQLRDGLSKLMRQQFGSPETVPTEAGQEVLSGIEVLKAAVPEIVSGNYGIAMGGIATSLGVPVEYAQLVVKPLLSDGTVVSRGIRKGTRYYVPDAAPPEDPVPEGQVGSGHEVVDEPFERFDL